MCAGYSDDCRDAELARERGCVLQQRAFFDDDSRNSCEQRCEMRMQNACYENRVARHDQSQ